MRFELITMISNYCTLVLRGVLAIVFFIGGYFINGIGLSIAMALGTQCLGS